MKLRVSLTEDDLRILDEFARQHDLPSRSAAVQRAVRALALDPLVDDYRAAFTEWHSGDGSAWDAVGGDGLRDAPR